MMKSSPLRMIAGLLLLLFANSCEIDVGNPHPVTSEETGQVSLALADAPSDSAKHVYLNIVSLSVIPQKDDGSDGDARAITLSASGRIDVLALQDGKSLDLTLAQSVPIGTYNGVILGLEPENPSSFVDQNDRESPLAIPDAGHEIVIAQEFEVKSGTALELTLHLDLRRSIVQGGDSNLAFEPYASLGRKDQEGSIKGIGVPAVATEVCAYLRRQQPGGDDRLVPPGVPGSRQRPDGRGDARMPPSSGPDGNFDQIDNDSTCDEAFATSVVRSNSFLLSHLWPGEYQLVYFRSDGSRLDQRPQIIRVQPGQNVEFNAGVLR